MKIKAKCKKTYGDAYFKGKTYKITKVTEYDEIFIDSVEYSPWLFLPDISNVRVHYKDNEKFSDFFHLTKKGKKKLEQMKHINILNKMPFKHIEKYVKYEKLKKTYA